MKHCHNCGAELADAATYCDSCRAAQTDFRPAEKDSASESLSIKFRENRLLAVMGNAAGLLFDLAEQTIRRHIFGIHDTIDFYWENVEDPPCATENIRAISGSDKEWLIAADDGVYRCEADAWDKVLEMDNSPGYLVFRRINDMWLLWGASNLWLSRNDGRVWKKMELPSNLKACMDIDAFAGQYLLTGVEYKEYTYKKKGIIFDSTETSSYNAPVFYLSKSLSGDWKKADSLCGLTEGLTFSGNVGIHGDTIVTCLIRDLAYAKFRGYSTLSTMIAFNKAGQGWQKSEWIKGQAFPSGGFFAYGHGKFILCGNKDRLVFGQSFLEAMVTELMKGQLESPNPSGQAIFVSRDGKKWLKVLKNIKDVAQMLPIGDFLFFPPLNSENIGYISDDGKHFHELRLYGKGEWRNFATNGREVMALYCPPEKKPVLRKGICIHRSSNGPVFVKVKNEREAE